jgi:glyoxylase-like metal-dependent hydrolase (beta-lactamase superfamily II)
MAFLTEAEPIRDVPLAVLPGVRRIVASNHGPMTYHGTNTYLLDGPDGTTVLDPGPDDARHVEAILAATDGRVARIFLTHTHSDHLGAVAALKAATGAPTHAFHKSAEPSFAADVPLRDGETVAGLTALHTPGHAADHLTFAFGDGILFTGDHVMSWNSSIVSPPRGDMADYMNSLRRLLARNDMVYLSGHGPPLAGPRAYVEDLIARRDERERAIVNALSRSLVTIQTLADQLYGKTDPMLRYASERNVLAHLLKLEAEGLAEQSGDGWISRAVSNPEKKR